MRSLLIAAGSLLIAAAVLAQQMADTSFLPTIDKPTFVAGHGPIVLIDEAHNNFHTAGERYLPFAELLRRDGYTIKQNITLFNADSLSKADVLVISNALNERNIEDWSLPTPSAFTEAEIVAVHDWVKQGGALFLIADHMPFPGAAGDLADVFGISFNNGFAVDSSTRGPAIFRRSDSTLMDHPITHRSGVSKQIDSVATFTGQAFQAQNWDFQPLLVFDSGFTSFMPEVAWEFADSTKKIPIEGWYQGGVMPYGDGRIAVFGEAAMFTAQIAGEQQRRFGMNSDVAGQNLSFLLNIMRWLSKEP